MLKAAIWLAAVFIGLFLVYVAVVSGAVMVMGIFTGRSELAAGGFAGLACTVILIVALVLWRMSKRKKIRVTQAEGMRSQSEPGISVREVEHR